MTIDTKLVIPDKFAKDFINGSLDISKAVVRSTKSGKIVKNVDLINNVDKAKDTASALRHSKLFLIGLGVIAVVGVASGIVYLVNKKNKKGGYV